MSEAVSRGTDCGQPGVVRARSRFVQWEMDRNRISERAAKRIEDGLGTLRKHYTDEEILTGDLARMVLDLVGWARWGQTCRRAGEDFRRYCAEAGP